MSQVPIESRVDVVVSAGGAPLDVPTYNTAAFLFDTTDAAFPDAFKVYTSTTEILTDGFNNTSKLYKFAEKAFAGKAKPPKIYAVKYRTAGTVLTAVNALTAFLQVDSTPYYVACDSRVQATQEALAAYCATVDRAFVTSIQVAGALVAATTTDLASVLKAAGNDHSVVLYNQTSDAEMVEGGIVGAMANVVAGTTVLDDKTMPLVTVSALNPTERTALDGKNCGYYMPIAGVQSYFNGKVSSGKWFDQVVFEDWLASSLKVAIYGAIKRASDQNKKISMDEAGFAKLRQAAYEPIFYGQREGSISLDFNPIVRTPTRAEITEADKAGRKIDMVVELLYTGAVGKVMVRAYVQI